MEKDKSFYITTTLPYVNAEPHIGFAMEIIRADIIARYQKLQGKDVFFNTGTDEHGLKIYQAAQAEGVEPQNYVDRFAERFRELKELLGISADVHFIRTTDQHHKKAAQEMWRRCKENGYIYKKNYKTKYCVGCELEKTDSELEDGRCPIHPHKDLELIEEENYFFQFSAFQQKLLDLYASNPDMVVPDFRFNEIRAFVERGLEDFSISRLKEKMPWGIPVPDDPEHVMYVWFDALTNYISTLGWPHDTQKFGKYWKNGTPVQYAGKDNLRQQAAMWQAMLLAADLPPTHTIVINGFITSGGQKMSKSVGNVIAPKDVIKEYGTDVLRYYTARHFHPFEDSDFTWERLKDDYNAHLANGLGNLVSRIMKMAEDSLDNPVDVQEKNLPQDFQKSLESFNLQEACDIVWRLIGDLDERIQESKPFKLIKEDPQMAKEIIAGLARDLYTIGHMLNPIMPETSQAIKQTVKENKKPEKPLFERK